MARAFKLEEGDSEGEELIASNHDDDKDAKSKQETNKIFEMVIWMVWLLIGTVLIIHLCLLVSVIANRHDMPTTVVLETVLQSKLRVLDSELFAKPSLASRQPEKNAIPRNIFLAGVTLVLNKGRYIREWIVFHKLMGFDFFLIFDHGSTDNTSAMLQPFIKEGSVVMLHARDSFPALCNHTDPGSNIHKQATCQMEVFNYAFRKLHAYGVEWVMNFDVDEFVWTPANGILLPEMLASKDHFYPYDVVTIHGMTFGHNGFEDAASHAGGLVIEQYTKRSALAKLKWSVYDQDRYIKKILFRPGSIYFAYVHDVKSWFGRETNVPPLSAHLRMNHYKFLSKAEQHEKSLANWNPEVDVQPERDALMNQVVDTEIMYLLPQVKAMLQSLNV